MVKKEAPTAASFDRNHLEEGGEVNPWTELWTPSIGDSKGRLAARCDSGMQDMVRALVIDVDSPWRNESEFIRFGVELGLEKANRVLRDPDLHDSLSKRRIIMTALKAEEEGRLMSEMTDRIRKVVEDMLKEGDIKGAMAHLLELRNVAIGMRSPRWRRKTMEVLEPYKKKGLL